MAKEQFEIEIRLRWWFRWLFLPLMSLTLSFCRLFDPTVNPDPDRMEWWFDRGVVFLSDGREIKIKNQERSDV